VQSALEEPQKTAIDYAKLLIGFLDHPESCLKGPLLPHKRKNIRLVVHVRLLPGADICCPPDVESPSGKTLRISSVGTINSGSEYSIFLFFPSYFFTPGKGTIALSARSTHPRTSKQHGKEQADGCGQMFHSGSLTGNVGNGESGEARGTSVARGGPDLFKRSSEIAPANVGCWG
jgi:hypothetical protein